MAKRRKIIRRLTPVDDPRVLEEWLELERVYVDEHGLSRHEAHQRIAASFLVSRMTVYRALSGDRLVQHNSTRSYSDRAKNLRYRERQAFLVDFRRNPERYLVLCYESPDEQLSLEELSVRLHERFSYLPHLPTLDKVIRASDLLGKSFLEAVASATDSPLRYRLTSAAWALYLSRFTRNGDK